MDDFIRAAQGVCYGATNEERCSSEVKMTLIIEQPGALDAFLDGLYTTEDTVFFFICLGLQRIFWKRFGQLDQNQQSRVIHVLSECLTIRGAGINIGHGSNLQAFARRKLEQVMACVCAQLGTLFPVVNVLQTLSSGHKSGALSSDIDSEAEMRRLVSSLSLLRTILEETLNLADPRLTPQQLQAAQVAAEGMVIPATSLACSTIQRFMGNLQDASTECGIAASSARQHHIALISLSIDTLKVILAKLPIGPHISTDVLHLLFALARVGARLDTQLEVLANSALECLQELMAKRFVPSNGLLFLATNASNLLTDYRAACKPDTSPRCLPAMLDFICSFSITHVARCMQLQSPEPGQPDGPGAVFQIVQEMAQLSQQCREPEVLVKLTEVWAELLEVDAVRGYMVGDLGTTTAPQLADSDKLELTKHFLYGSMCSHNAALAEVSLIQRSFL